MFAPFRFLSRLPGAIPIGLVLAFLALSSSLYGADRSRGETPFEDLIPASLISLSWDDGPGHAIVVEKESQTLRVYERQGGFLLKHTFPCSTGEVVGKKQKAGDRKTPEGIYFFTKAFEKKYLSSTYGNGAFVLDYPNLLDRRENRNGNNIWLHGTNKALKPRDSNGCVAVENGNIDVLAKYIRLNRTPIIIKQKLHMVPASSLAAEKKGLADFLEGWKSAFTSGDKVKYDACYSESSGDRDILWKAWTSVRRAWDESRLSARIRLKNVTLARANPCVVALFDQRVELGQHVMRVGTQKLFLEPEGDSWKIVGEVYLPGTAKEDVDHPLADSLVRLDRLYKNYKTVAELIGEWAKAWSSKDIKRYEACYSDDFRAQRKNLKSWIRYKERLNKRYDYIKVTVEDLEISEEEDRSTATFVQRYRSSGNHSVGIKRLRLKREGGLWKIYREAWHKI